MIRNSILAQKPVKKFTGTGEDMIDLASQTFIFPDYFEFEVAEVTEATEARPDILSYNMYSTDEYGDLICKINDISNPFDLSVGTRLILPKEQYLKSFFTVERFNIDDTEESDRSSQSKPVPKKRNQKRKSNEAVSGDIRFRIDKNSKVIFY